MLSFWEKETFGQYDYAIAGSGLTGLTAALVLKERHPAARVAVFERGLLPSGASTKNAGFACFGSLTELLADLRTQTPDAVRTLVYQRLEGLRQLRQRLGDAEIDYRRYGGYELLTEEQLPLLDKIGEINELLSPIFKGEYLKEANDHLPGMGFSQQVKALVRCPHEGQIDTGKMMQVLLQRARQADIELYTGCKLTAFSESKSGVALELTTAGAAKAMTIYTGKLGICTNAFAAELLPQLQVTPGRGQIIITAPLGDVPFQGTFHAEEGFYYFRNVGQRILLGGGRHLAIEAETTTELSTTSTIQSELERYLHEVVAPGLNCKVEHRWAGIMGFAESKQPIVEEVAPNVAVGVKLGGMGVALGSLVGEQVAELML